MPATRLTFKQKLFAHKYVENKGNGRQTALQVYDTKDPSVADNIASENLSKPLVKQTIDQIAESIGLTSSTILNNFKQIAVVKPEKVSAEAVLKANIEAAKILGLYPGTKHARLSINMKGNIKDMSHKEVKEELTIIDNELNNLLDEPDNPTTEA